MKKTKEEKKITNEMVRAWYIENIDKEFGIISKKSEESLKDEIDALKRDIELRDLGLNFRFNRRERYVNKLFQLAGEDIEELDREIKKKERTNKVFNVLCAILIIVSCVGIYSSIVSILKRNNIEPEVISIEQEMLKELIGIKECRRIFLEVVGTEFAIVDYLRRKPLKTIDAEQDIYYMKGFGVFVSHTHCNDCSTPIYDVIVDGQTIRNTSFYELDLCNSCAKRLLDPTFYRNVITLGYDAAYREVK